jgi:hypothetical protein
LLNNVVEAKAVNVSTTRLLELDSNMPPLLLPADRLPLPHRQRGRGYICEVSLVRFKKEIAEWFGIF